MMKQLLYFFFGLLLLTGCGKDKKDDPTPKNPAEAVAGLYTMTSYSEDGNKSQLNLPFTGPNGEVLSGTISVVAVSGKQEDGNMTITLKITGQPDATGGGPVQVKAAAKGYELFDSGQKIGTVEGNTLTFTEDEIVIVAKK